MGNRLSATTAFAPPQVISISTNATMQVFVLLAIVAAATAAPTFVVPSAPIARIDGAPIAHIGAATTYSHAIPSTYVAGSSFPLLHNTPLTYSAVNPIVYSSSHVVAPAVVPKSVAQTKGTSHIVY